MDWKFFGRAMPNKNARYNRSMGCQSIGTCEAFLRYATVCTKWLSLKIGCICLLAHSNERMDGLDEVEVKTEKESNIDWLDGYTCNIMGYRTQHLPLSLYLRWSQCCYCTLFAAHRLRVRIMCLPRNSNIILYLCHGSERYVAASPFFFSKKYYSSYYRNQTIGKLYRAHIERFRWTSWSSGTRLVNISDRLVTRT